MAIDLKYGKINIPGIDDDEPVFIIRAQDKASVEAIGAYAQAAQISGASEALIDSAISSRSAFVSWQDANVDRVKVPD